MRATVALALLCGMLVSAAPVDHYTVGSGGVTLRTETISADDLAEVMGAWVWKFDASLPAGAERVSVGLQVQRKGQPAIRLGGSVVGSTELGNRVLVGLIPIENGNGEVEKFRVTIDAFGTCSSTTIDNPLKGLGLGRPACPVSAGDGVFDLVGGYKGNIVKSSISDADVVLSLKIIAEK